VSVWQRVKARLGLEDEWDGYDEDEYDDEPDEVEDGYDPPRRHAYQSPYGAESSSVRRVEREEHERRSARPLRSVPAGPASVTTVSPQVRIHIVEPKSFGEAQTIADKFKQGTPVVMNLAATKSELSKRLLDFAAGLTYGLDGGLQRVSERVFLLTPANVDVSAEDRRRMRDTGLFGLEI
jgi:cell division inhibitor SepF